MSHQKNLLVMNNWECRWNSFRRKSTCLARFPPQTARFARSLNKQHH